MQLYSIRIELKLADAHSICNFTIKAPFVATPAKGDIIIIEFKTRIALKIKSICHFVDDPICSLLVTDSIVCEDYDDILKHLDWFKAKYDVTDIQSEEQPRSYYVFYRTLLKLLGKTKDVNPTIKSDADSIKILAEVCRSILLAQISIDNASVSVNDVSAQIESLHNDILRKKRSDSDKILLLDVIKTWEHKINTKNWQWNVTDDSCHYWLLKSFSRLKSISVDDIRRLVD